MGKTDSIIPGVSADKAGNGTPSGSEALNALTQAFLSGDMSKFSECVTECMIAMRSRREDPSCLSDPAASPGVGAKPKEAAQNLDEKPKEAAQNLTGKPKEDVPDLAKEGTDSDGRMGPGNPKQERQRPAFEVFMTKAAASRSAIIEAISAMENASAKSKVAEWEAKRMAAGLDLANFTRGVQGDVESDLNSVLLSVDKAAKRLEEARDLLAAVDEAIAEAAPNRDTAKAGKAQRLADKNLEYVNRLRDGVKNRKGVLQCVAEAVDRCEVMRNRIKAFADKNGLADSEGKECAEALRKEGRYFPKIKSGFVAPLITAFSEAAAEELQLYGVLPTGADEERVFDLLKALGKDAIKDSRDPSQLDYDSLDVAVAIILGLLCGACSWKFIGQYADNQEGILAKHLKSFAGGTPDPSTLQRYAMSFETDALKGIVRTFEKIILYMCERHGVIPKLPFGREFIAMDGKCSKGSRKSVSDGPDTDPVFTMNKLSCFSGLCTDGEFVAAKTNEQESFRVMALRNASFHAASDKGPVFLADSMSFQKDSLAAAKACNGDYVIGMKGSHRHIVQSAHKLLTWATRMSILHGCLENAADEIASDEERAAPGIAYDPKCHSFHRLVEESHSSLIFYDYYMTTELSKLEDRDDFEGLEAIVCLVKRIVPNNRGKRIIKEVRYYVSSVPDVKLSAYAIRCEWMVEAMHWLLDSTLMDDLNQTTAGHGAEQLQLFKKLVLGMLVYSRVEPGKKGTKSARLLLANNSYHFYNLCFFLAKFIDGAYTYYTYEGKN